MSDSSPSATDHHRTTGVDVARVAASIEQTAALDGSVQAMTDVGARLLGDGRARRALDGQWLGHVLHPALTDLPIGFWTSAFVLDLCGPDSAGAADLCVAIGTACALPTAAAGLADWLRLTPSARRVGIVHAASNIVATTLYGASWLCRRRGSRGTGVALAMAGSAAASFGGLLGGHLAFAGKLRKHAPLKQPLTQAEIDECVALIAMARDRASARLRSLERDWQSIVDASDTANLDDEHDPEGATVAYERAMVSSLLEAARSSFAALAAATWRVDRGVYGACGLCGRSIGIERLRADPAATACIVCATRS